MIGKLKIGNLNVKFVLRHRFEKKKSFDTAFLKWELGVWFRKSKIVGRKDIKHCDKWHTNLVNSYMFGINILIAKIWVEYDRGGMHFEIGE